MYLLVGLGNIGKEYELTRHNFGFLLLDQIIKDYGLNLQSKKFKSEVFSGEISQKKIIAIKPQTYMNRSGIAVLEVMSFYKISLQNVIVLHDEIDLELGRMKVKIGGSSAGHNGLKSIDEMIGSNYIRVRLGVGRGEFSTADYVLSNFTKEELLQVEKINEKISKLIPTLLENQLQDFSNKFYL